ncbi:hypothetical protein QWJ07_26405 [Frankia sp. RB7]|nr:hypothetical protein [Frankia sp. RB7]
MAAYVSISITATGAPNILVLAWPASYPRNKKREPAKCRAAPFRSEDNVAI